MEGKAWTPDEVAAVFQISKHTVYELIKRGELQAFKVGNKMRIESMELERFKEKMKTVSKSVSAEPLPNNPAVSSPIRLAGSHDFLVENFAKEAGGVFHIQIQPTYVGSLEGLMMLYRGQCDIAAIHLLDPSSQQYNLPFIQQLFIYESITLVRFATREQGFIVAKGNPKKILGFKDLTRKDIQFINRQKGSGTRFLLDANLARHHIDPTGIKGYEREEWNHLATASQVSRGSADAAFGIRPAASRLGLEFIPVAEECFDLVFRFSPDNAKTLSSLIGFLQSLCFKNSLTDLEGYDIKELGTIIYQNCSWEETTCSKNGFYQYF